jgi:hypothetical protein
MQKVCIGSETSWEEFNRLFRQIVVEGDVLTLTTVDCHREFPVASGEPRRYVNEIYTIGPGVHLATRAIKNIPEPLLAANIVTAPDEVRAYHMRIGHNPRTAGSFVIQSTDRDLVGEIHEMVLEYYLSVQKLLFFTKHWLFTRFPHRHLLEYRMFDDLRPRRC